MRLDLTILRSPEARPHLIIGSLSSLVALLVALLLLAPRNSFTQLVSPDRADIAWLPAANAMLNASSAICLLVGFCFIRRRQIRLHRTCMLAAFSLSVLFLLSYLFYHALSGPTQFNGVGWIRSVYHAILISHIVLAIFVLPLALTTLYRAWREKFFRHRHIARWTLPIWLYVSISGVVVYLLLYHFP